MALQMQCPSALRFTRAINRFFMKLFKSNNIDIVRKCQEEFAFSLPSVLLAHRSELFLAKYKHCDNAFC